MYNKASSLHPSKESKNLYSPTPKRKSLICPPYITCIYDRILHKRISKVIKPNPERATIIDTSDIFGSPIETEIPTSFTPLETLKMDITSKNPKELGSPTLFEFKLIFA